MLTNRKTAAGGHGMSPGHGMSVAGKRLAAASLVIIVAVVVVAVILSVRAGQAQRQKAFSLRVDSILQKSGGAGLSKGQIDWLRTLAASPDVFTADQAMTSLSWATDPYGRQVGIRVALSHLHDSRWLLRQGALGALRRLDPSAARTAAQGLVGDPNAWVRKETQRILNPGAS